MWGIIGKVQCLIPTVRWIIAIVCCLNVRPNYESAVPMCEGVVLNTEPGITVCKLHNWFALRS